MKMNNDNLIPAKTTTEIIKNGLALGLSQDAAELLPSLHAYTKSVPIMEQHHAFDAWVNTQQGLAREGYVKSEAIDELILLRRSGKGF
jgi:hypothetical protein